MKITKIIMRLINIVISKVKLAKKNPKQIIIWFNKLIYLINGDPLNNGERYDPNIMKGFGVDHKDQTERYNFALKLLNKEDSILDIACGTGYGTKIIAEKCLYATGVDISTKAIKYAKRKYKKNNINFIVSDINNISGSYDRIISFETIEHIKLPIEESVKKLVKMAKKQVILSVPFMENPGHNKHHAHFEINENKFKFLAPENKILFLYQKNNGDIERRPTKQTNTLIVIIEK